MTAYLLTPPTDTSRRIRLVIDSALASMETAIDEKQSIFATLACEDARRQLAAFRAAGYTVRQERAPEVKPIPIPTPVVVLPTDPLQQAYVDWASGNAYSACGEYRLRRQIVSGQAAVNQIAPWNAAVRAAYPRHADFQAAASKKGKTPA